MRVRTALQLINQEKDAYLESQEGELDTDTRFCIVWYDQYGYSDAPFGKADDLARAKDTSFDGLRRAGVLASEAGKVRLLSRAELAEDWDPQTDRRLTIWEATQHLIRRFEDKERGGTQAAGGLLAALGAERGEAARALAYRLFTLCERRNRAEEALAYNGLIAAWPDIQRAASDIASTRYHQEQLTH